MRFNPTRSASLRRLRTAFSSSSSTSTSSTSTPSSSAAASPNLDGRAWSPSSATYDYSDSPSSMHSNAYSINEILEARRRPSGPEQEMIEEAHEFPVSVCLLEPRPEAPPTTRGVFEVLNGDA